MGGGMPLAYTALASTNLTAHTLDTSMSPPCTHLCRNMCVVKARLRSVARNAV